MTACPEPDVLGQYVDDALVVDLRLTVEEHIDGCEDCRATVSMLARAAAVERASQPVLEGTHVDPATAPTELPAAGDTVGEVPQSGKRKAESPLAGGTRVGRYVIGELLGVGGMGIVYTARDPDLGRDIAIKILRPEFARAHRDATVRIIREAQAMARVAHPNVVGVYDVGTVEDRVFIAMENVQGTNLRDWLAAQRRTPAQILELFTAAGRGLIAAHDAGMVHRDFKPDNVLIGADGRPRVTDFGLAYDQVEDGDAEADGKTRPIVGTPAYMAPEQHAGGNLDARTDQFSFAIALYEALYGKRPFAGTTREALADAVTRGQVQPPPPGSRVPASLHAILLRALSVKPGARFPTLASLLEAIGRDRARRPRELAFAASIALVVVGMAFLADLETRDRVATITRSSFGGARAQLEKLVALRTETFVAQSDALYRLPAVEEVASSRDLVDFGLGDAADDRRRLEHIHDNLSSADWATLARTRSDVLAIADAKGRLLFGSASSAVWGADVTQIAALDAAYDAASETSIAMIDGADRSVVASGLLGGKPHPGLYVLFTRAKRIGPRPRAMFVQAIRAGRLLDEVSVGDDTKLSLVSSDGLADGSVPDEVLRATTTGGIDELAVDGRHWLAQRTSLSADSRHAIDLVMTRDYDVGLAGLFPRARIAFAVLAGLLAMLSVGGFVLARRRDLSR